MLTSLIKFLLDPFNILWLLLLACLAVWLFRKDRLLKWLIIVTAVFFLIVSTPLVPITLINSLEDRYEPLYVEELKDPDAKYHIVVLGAGHGIDERLPPNSLLSNSALGRLNEGIRLHRKLPNSKLVLSGYSSSGRTTQAEMLQMTALILGVEKESTLVQNEPGNTYEEARVYATRYSDNHHQAIVVTSAAHMPRAVMMFKRFGIEPIPSPTNYMLKGSWKRKKFGLPSVGNMERFRVGISSYAAMFRYRYWD